MTEQQSEKQPLKSRINSRTSPIRSATTSRMEAGLHGASVEAYQCFLEDVHHGPGVEPPFARGRCSRRTPAERAPSETGGSRSATSATPSLSGTPFGCFMRCFPARTDPP